ncbi:TonB-dependent receptor [Brevundimonas nasdae]|uniref:TonB-dependent receptor n=1 Tax=Brevundimonas nasdae TaxID=172043 RepID=UPI003F691019
MSSTASTGRKAMGASSLAFAMIGGFAALPAHAADEAADQTHSGQSAAAVDDVVVNGLRRQEPKQTARLLDTPRSITVIPEEIIQTTGSTSLMDALRTVPGITFGAGEGGNPLGDRPFLRGSDTQSSTFVDGARDIGAQSREVFNIESIDVIKGASGAYTGRGGAGGGIYIVNKTAGPGNVISGSLGAGTDAYGRATLDVNYQLTDSAAVRLNAMVHQNDVAGRDEVNNSRWGIAPTLTLGLNSPTRAYFSYYHLQTDDLPDAGIPYNNPTLRPRTDVPQVLATGDGAPVSVGRNTFYGLVNRDFRKENVDTGTIRIEHDLSAALHIRNTTRYGETSQDNIYTQPDDTQGNIYYGYVWRRANTRISEVTSLINQTDLYGTFTTGNIAHSFSAGLELSREESENDSYTITSGGQVLSAYNRCLPGAVASFNCTSLYNPNPNDAWTGVISKTGNPSNAKTTTKAIYLFDTLTLNPQWQINVGLRYDIYDAEFVSARNTTTQLRTTYKRSDDLFNYQLGVVYKPIPAASVYATYSSSSTPVGSSLTQGSDPNGLSSDINAALVPEKNDAYEIGGKIDLLNGGLSLSGAVFRVETNNARVTVSDGTVAQVGQKLIQGLELGVNGQITSQWSVFAGYTYMDSELVRAGGSGANYGLNDGIRFPNTPEHSASITTNYQVTPKINVGGGVYYMGKVYGNASTLTPTSTKFIPEYTRVDVNATYVINPNLNLRLNVQNLTDEFYFNQAYPTHYASVAPGRSGTLTLNFRY